MSQNGSRPVILNCSLDVKNSFVDIFSLGNNDNIVPPWYLRSKLLRNFILFRSEAVLSLDKFKISPCIYLW